MILSIEQINEFVNYLCREEKSAATQEKYLRDVQAFRVYAEGNHITKELLVAWKKQLGESGYAVRSINSMLASVNSLLDFLGLSACKVKNIRTQRQIYCPEEKELTKAEYLRLLKASKVFPHNLRKLVARTFYSIEKDIAKLADILGHSSINTARIYIMTTGNEHRQKLSVWDL